MNRRLSSLVVVVVAALALAGCGGSTSGTSSTAHASAQPATDRLDSIAVLGHSGTTGYNSDPAQLGSDVRANSWATGTNPEVDSVYLRLLATHPALKGHAYGVGVDGSDVDDLPAQVESLLATAKPLPDLVMIQSIDNDIRCDGTDPQNYAPYAQKLDAVLTDLARRVQGVQVFLPGVAVDPQHYTDAMAGKPDVVRANEGTGLCDLFTPAGKERPKAIAYQQQLVDAYFEQVEAVCAKHPGCFTDEGRMQDLQVQPDDLTTDGNHLTVSGLTKEAALVWSVLPAALKDRP